MFINLLIIGATVLVSILALSNHDLKYKLCHWPSVEAQRKEYHRWITSGFVHADAVHLIFNMMTLYFFGPYVESWFRELIPEVGHIFYLIFYVAALAMSSAATYFRHRHHSGYTSVGASGATAAVLFASILLNPTIGIGLFFIPIAIPGFIFGPLYLWYSSYAANHARDGIDHTAHFYGALFGLVLPVVLDPYLLPAFVEKMNMWFSMHF